jgi:NAD(P)-dependent dehydrogenase (short-subunit alcohol dehydrogenase family)
MLMKTALITGAARGIGAALAQTHLSLGHRVILVDKDEVALKEQKAALSQAYPHPILALTCDVTSQSAVAALADALQQEGLSLQYLYNNAGIMGELAPVWALDCARVQQVMAVNVYGLLYLIQACMPLLEASANPAHIVNISSLYGVCSGSHMAAYAMSKHAVLALSEALYFDCKQYEKPIHVAVAFPSFTDTALLSGDTTNPVQKAIQPLLSHARPAQDVAQYIVKAVDNKQFYIVPDKEVKGYCEDRAKAIIQESNPDEHSIEKIMRTLVKREVCC